MASSSSSAASPSPTLGKHDVFISFRGEDTRRIFVSHLCKTLRQKKIETYFDYDLHRGENISQALFQAIEESTLWVIIFSENYASSRWCLDELVKILECMKENRSVIPVFYNIDPSHVRHQTGSYEQAIALHNNEDKVQEWKDALTRTANFSGWDSRKFSDDAEFIEAIVEDVRKKLTNLHPIDSSLSSNLVGIEEQIAEIELLMRIESPNIFMIGLWGMGGIGKTTIAETIYKKLSSNYEGCCFVANVREKFLKHEVKSIAEDLFSTLLEEKVDIDTPHVESTSFIVKRLKQKKVLIVLDDVNSSGQLDELVGEHSWFGIGSRIVATTRDKQAISKRADRIYEVKERKFDEARQIFCACAFQGNELPADYMALCVRVLDYAKGVPLALKVLGSLLYGKSKNEWESALNKLKKIPNEHIQKVLRLSYDSLDLEEKEIFLDIAHFFKDKRQHYVKQMLNGCDFHTDSGIRTLLDKSLITISSENSISMHDLIQEMGLDVVRQECIKEPGRRSRLENHEEIQHILNNNKGTDTIEGIKLCVPLPIMLDLRPNVFVSMHKLRLLMFDIQGYRDQRVYVSKGLDSFPNDLRHLHWNGYPLKSLPSSYCPEKLVTLTLGYSKIEKLWNGVQELPNLESLRLARCEGLIELPDLSKAQNLRSIVLKECSSLVHLPSSIEYLQKLDSLHLDGCTKLRSIPRLHMRSLSNLHLDRCEALMYLILSFTNIQSIPASIRHISHLRSLDVRHCERLESLPQLPSSLRQLDASGCTQLETITSFSLGMITPYWKEYTNNEKYNSCIEKLLFSHCRKLDQKTLKNIEVEAKLSVHRVAYLYSRKILEGVIFKGSDHPEAQICFPGSEIPEWFGYSRAGSSITIEFHPALLYNPNFLGFTLCSVTTGCVLVQCKVSFGEHLVQTEYCRDASCASCTNSNDQVLMNYQTDFNSRLVENLKELFNPGTVSQLVMMTFEFDPHSCIKKNGVSMVCATCIENNGVSMVCVQDQDCLLQRIGTKRRRDESGHNESEICMLDKKEWW